MNNMTFAGIQELQKALREGALSSQNLAKSLLEKAERNKHLGACIEQFSLESVIDKSSDREGLLSGIPGYLKDNIAQEGRALTCASGILQGFVANYDATVTERLKKEGALLLGRANMDEFAMGSSGETSFYGKTKNPWNLDCVPGGSSSGSAAIVAAGLAPWALGSDTGGSVRQPAAMCGIFGLKPTYGLVSRYGLVAYGSSLDTIGVFSRSVYDNALVLSVIAGHDSKDSTSLPVEQKNYTEGLTGTLKPGLKIGIITQALEAPDLDHEIKKALQDALEVYKKMGATIVPISMNTLQYGAATYFIISRAEAASNLARFDGVRYGMRSERSKNLNDLYAETRHDGFGKEVRARILVGNYTLSAGHAGQFYNNAQRVRRMIRQEFTDAFKEVDLLVMPTHPVTAFKSGQYDANPLVMDLQDYFTCPVNLAGIPALSLPIGFSSDQKPIGMQLIGPHLSEAFLYETAYAYEKVTDWHTKHPITK